MDLTKIIELIIAVLSAILTYVLVPYLRAKTSEAQKQKIKDIVKDAVQAAEMIYGSNMGQTKKEYVLSYLSKRGFTIDANELDVFIESAVLELKKNLE